MRQQISRFAVHQTSKIVAVVYFVIGIILVPIFILAGRASPDSGPMLWVGVAMPLIYAVFGYIFTAIALAVYNWLAGRVGGIEFELTSVGPPGS